MGNNIDMIELLGLPKEAKCPGCGLMRKTGFDDYDIECGRPEAARNGGRLTLGIYCDVCGHEWQMRFKTREADHG